MTAQLSKCVQNFVVMTLLQFEIQQNEIAIKSDFGEKKSLVGWAPRWPV